jgi:hypothetical protein
MVWLVREERRYRYESDGLVVREERRCRMITWLPAC